MSKRVQINIKALTTKHNISLRELARLSDINHATLSNLSTGKRKNIHFAHIERIAEALGISDIREIIELDEDNS
jgi:putative transcriptional regulator